MHKGKHKLVEFEMNGIFTSLCRTHLNIQIDAEAVKSPFSFIGGIKQNSCSSSLQIFIRFCLDSFEITGTSFILHQKAFKVSVHVKFTTIKSIAGT